MQDNIAYNAVQLSNLTSSEYVYEIPDHRQIQKKVEPVASHIKTRRPCVKCSNLVTAIAILLAVLAVILSVTQLIIASKQEQKLQLCESNVQNFHKTLNNTISSLRLELLRSQDNASKQLPSQTEPEPATIVTPTTHPSETCGGPGWRRIAFINMTDSNQDCPQGLSLTSYSIRSCGRGHTGSSACSSTTFPVTVPQYSQVCGRVTAYRWGSNNAFYGYHINHQDINGYYVSSGLSLTHGQPRTHIWTFASGLFNGTSGDTRPDLRCPCDPGNTYGSPPFVGDDYFCDSVVTAQNQSELQFFPNNALWDGLDLLNPCYGRNNPPWFNKTLPEPITDDIELRMCFTNSNFFSDIAIELLEIYVQ